jgi:AraC-like DNA-binding protein
MLSTVNQMLYTLAAFQYFVFAGFLLFVKRGNRFAHRLLAAFLIGKGICVIDILLGLHGSYFLDRCPHVFFIGWPFSLVYPPLLFWYVRAAAGRDSRWTWKHGLTLIPFAAVAVLATAAYHVHDAETKRRLLARPLFPQAVWTAFAAFYWTQVFGYLAGAWLTLRGYRERLKEYYSSVERHSLSWLSVVLCGFTGVYALSFASEAYARLAGRGSAALDLALNASFLVFVVMLTLKGLAQPESLGIPDESSRSKGVSIDKTLQERYLEKLQEVMQGQKPYRDPLLTLDGLAEKVAVPPRHLSFLINNALNKNFFDLVNGYRIEEAKRILRQPAEKSRTVLDVLYEVGFNSKSVFNTAFKKYTGVTPREFRRMSAN